jgi:hypothetical protein
MKIGWLARVSHYESLMALALGADANRAESAQMEGRKRVTNTHSVVPLIAFNFLVLIGILGNDDLQRRISERRSHIARYLRRMDSTLQVRQAREMALTLMILGNLGECSAGLGLTPIFLDTCSTVADRLLRVPGS